MTRFRPLLFCTLAAAGIAGCGGAGEPSATSASAGGEHASHATATGKWTVAEGSKLTFDFVQVSSKYTGYVDTFGAEIEFDPAAPAAGKIVGTAELASVDTEDPERDAQLASKDFFNVAEFPQARFESRSIAAAGGGFRADGELTIKGTTKPAALEFTFAASGPNAATFAGKMKVNRFDYNVGNESMPDTTWAGQDVTINIDLKLTR